MGVIPWQRLPLRFPRLVHAKERASGTAEYNYVKGEFPSEEAPGPSVFFKDYGAVFHTCSTYARGLDIIVGTYNLLDLAPKGHDEDALPWSMARVRRHDEYGRDEACVPAARD